MLTQKCFLLFFAFLLIIIASSMTPNSNGVEAMQVLTLPRKGYSKSQAYSMLGLVCKCCDGEGGECRSTWEATCSNLRCHPWKY